VIDAADFDHAARALEREGFGRQAGRTAGWAVRRAANAVRRTVRAAARPHRKTGRMSQRISVKVQGAGLDTTARVHAGGVAAIIVRGSRPHDIAPVRSRALAMTTNGRAGGPLVGFATAIHHPGTRPDPFVQQGIEQAQPEVQRIIQEAGDTMRRELAYRIERRR
jgi:hypothetical protein